MPSYHDLHITTATIPRTSILNLPFGLEVSCNRVSGWQLWRHGIEVEQLLAGEFDGPDQWLVLDIAGTVILDSRENKDAP